MSQQLITWILDYSRHLTAVITGKQTVFINWQLLHFNVFYHKNHLHRTGDQFMFSCFLVSYTCLGAVQTILYIAKYEQEMQVSICLKYYGYQGHIVAGSWIGISNKRFVTFLRFERNPFKYGPNLENLCSNLATRLKVSWSPPGVFHYLTECRPIIQVLFIDFVRQN